MLRKHGTDLRNASSNWPVPASATSGFCTMPPCFIWRKKTRRVSEHCDYRLGPKSECLLWVVINRQVTRRRDVCFHQVRTWSAARARCTEKRLLLSQFCHGRKTCASTCDGGNWRGNAFMP